MVMEVVAMEVEVEVKAGSMPKAVAMPQQLLRQLLFRSLLHEVRLHLVCVAVFQSCSSRV